MIKDVWDVFKDVKDLQNTKDLAAKVPELEARIKALETKLNGDGRVCEHCGSTNLTRTGTESISAQFDLVGKRYAVFKCGDCGEKSRFSGKF